MTPGFSSLQSFFAMNGYAFHVWTSFSVTLASILILLFFIWFQNKKVEKTALKQIQLSIHKNTTDPLKS